MKRQVTQSSQFMEEPEALLKSYRQSLGLINEPIDIFLSWRPPTEVPRLMEGTLGLHMGPSSRQICHYGRPPGSEEGTLGIGLAHLYGSTPMSDKSAQKKVYNCTHLDHLELSIRSNLNILFSLWNFRNNTSKFILLYSCYKQLSNNDVVHNILYSNYSSCTGK